MSLLRVLQRLTAGASLVAALWSGMVHAGIDQWTTNGPYGGQVTVLAMDPQTPANLYAAGFSSVFRSADGGASWMRASSGIDDPSVAAIAIDPVAPATLYAGSIHGARLYKSSDGAATWAPLATGPTLVVALAVDPVTHATVYASRQGVGLSKSTDSGGTWNPASNGLPALANIKSLVIDPTSPSTIYAGDNSKGVFKSTDGGATWNPANAGFITSGSGTIIQVYALAIDPSSPVTLYAAAATSTGQGVFKTTDGGGNWTQIVNSQVGAYNFYIGTVAVDPVVPQTVYLGSAAGAHTSTNGGTTFAPIQSGLPARTVNVFAINPTLANHANVAAGTENGIFTTLNAGGTWAAASNGLGLTAVTAVAVDPVMPTTVYAGTTYSGIFKSVDSGGSWTSVNTGIPPTGNLGCGVPRISTLAIDPKTPATIYAGTQCTAASAVLKSVDGGAHWATAASGLPSFAGTTALAIDPIATANLYAGTSGSGLFQSVDFGFSWTAAATDATIGNNIVGVAINYIPAGSTVDVSVLGNGPAAAGAPIPVVVVTDADGGTFSVNGGAPHPFTVKGDCPKQYQTILTTGFGANETYEELLIACLSKFFNAGKASNGYAIKFVVSSASPTAVERVAAIAPHEATVLQPIRANFNANHVGGVTAVAPEVHFFGPPNDSDSDATACSPFTSFAFNPFDPTAASFYAGAACGVLSATNYGEQIASMNSGLPTNLQVNSLATSSTRVALYAGTAGGGVYQFTFGPQSPTRLGITNVNGGISPVVAAPFNVVVTAQAADFSPQNVGAPTTVQLSVTAGIGTLGGSTSCQIPAGLAHCTVTGVTYSVVDTGVVLTATRTGGDTLTAGSSAPFNVVAVGPPSLTGAASRKIHGGAGTFDLPLTP